MSTHTDKTNGAAAVPASPVVPQSMRSILPLVLSNLLLSALFALMLWPAVSHDLISIWLGASVVIGIVEFAAGKPSPPTAESSASRSRLLIGINLVVGAQWMIAAALFYPAYQQDLLFFWLFSLAAPALCAAVYQHSDLTVCFARLGLALPIAALQLLQDGRPLYLLQAAIVVALWASLIWLAIRLHSSLRSRAELIATRDALLQKVADNARDLEALHASEALSRRQAELANLAKSRFLAHSSHDLRQPLHAISLLLETIDDEQLDRSTSHVVARVRQSVEQLASLFDSLLDLTLLDTGQVQLGESAVQVDRVFAEVIADLSTVAEANAVNIVHESTQLRIFADLTVVRRMIQNLLANAIRHTAGGTVTLRAKCVDDRAYLEVEDTGDGIAEADQARIFDEFTKLDRAPDEQAAGSLGLGLAIVSRLARLSGVDVSVESELSKGSIFGIGPFALAAITESSAVARSTPALDLKGTRVIVVDDDVDTLRATGRLVRKWGMVESLLESGDLEAMVSPDMLVCDYELGVEENGIDVIHAARRHFDRSIPALLISGNTSPELADMAAAADLRLLHKPVRPAQLKSAILTLLGSASNEQ